MKDQVAATEPARSQDIRPRICVLLNEGSGRNRATGFATRVHDAFADAGERAEIRTLSRREKVEEQAARAVADGFATVVAAGGDGTINGVAGALLGTGTRMGILPAGTFNYFARSLNLPQTVEEAAKVIVGGVPRPVRTATVNGQVFLNNASLGAYSAILEEREEIYRRWGRSRVAAYWSAIKALLTWRGPMTIELHANGITRRHRTPLVFIVNNAYQLDEIALGGRECIEKGEMVAFIAADTGRWGMLRHAFALMTGLAIPRHRFTRVCAREMRIDSSRRRQTIARDGERGKIEGPMTFAVDDDSLTVMVPAGAAEGTR